MNRNFGKLTDGKLTYAPKTLWNGDTCYCNPTAEQYAAQGWLAVHEEKPTDKVGVYYIADGWEERYGAIYRKWHEEPIVYAQFAAAKDAIIAAGIATAEEVEAILAASVDEEVH